MENDLLQYFTGYEAAANVKKTQLKRTATELRRAGITTMTELCGLCEHSPDKIRRLRNIGGKSWELILAVCAAYPKVNKEEEHNE